jgi:hypothetical protein
VLIALATGYLDRHPGLGRMSSNPCTDERSADHAEQTTRVEDSGAVKTVTIVRLTGIVRQGCKRFSQHQATGRPYQRILSLVGVRSPRDLEVEDASSRNERSRGGRISIRTERECVRGR